MLRTKREIWFVVTLSLIFIAANSYLLYHQSLLASALPFMLLIGVWVFFAPSKLFFVLVLLAPLSIPLRRIIPGLEFDFWFPTEPILVFLLVMLFLKSLRDRFFAKSLLEEPLFWAMIFYIGWMMIAIITSEMPIVSVKYILVRFWFIGVFFYLAYVLFRQNTVNVNRFLVLYIAGLFVVSVLSIIKQARFGLFNHYVAHQASSPFFIDHTSYGAALALVIPVSIALAVNEKRKRLKNLLWGLSLFFVLALLLSYSRAAWLSFIIASAVWVLILLKVRFRRLILPTLIILAAFFVFQEEIFWKLERNTTDSSGDFTEHVQSIINIKSDASNLERINRWDAAINMFKERPLFGWGPGTYQFQYAPFQMSYNKTIISTNFGTGGNAHSEYLGLLAESGVPALLGFLLIVFFALATGFRTIKMDGLLPAERNIVTACLIGLITYVFHGALNNFLDVDKIAVLFWGYMAIMMAYKHNAKTMSVKQQENLLELKTQNGDIIKNSNDF